MQRMGMKQSIKAISLVAPLLAAVFALFGAGEASAAAGSLCANVLGAGSAVCGALDGTNVGKLNPTHYSQVAGASAPYQIIWRGTETTDYVTGGNCAAGQVEVTLQHSVLGNTSVCGTLDGTGKIIDFTWTAPANGCQTGVVVYASTDSSGKTQANRDILNDGADDGSPTQVAGIGYVASGHPTGPALACTAATTEIHKGDDHTTNVTLVSVPATVHDKAIVTSGAGTPTGTVTFTFFDNLTCEGTGTFAGTVALVNGVADPSSSFNITQAGSYSFRAHYDGNATFGAADAACEPLQAVDERPQTGSLMVCKYEDRDVNGINNSELPLSSWSFTINPVSGAPEGATQVTDATGCVTWTNLAPGQYTVSEALQSGPPAWFNTDPGDNGPCLSSTCPNPSKSATVEAATQANLSFGNVQGAEIKVCKYEDKNANGVKNDGEGPLSGWTMTVLDGQTVVSSGDTDDSGCVTFLVLPNRAYTVQETLKTGWFNTDPGNNGAPCLPAVCPNPSKAIDATAVTPGATPQVDFGNVESAEKHGKKFYDKDTGGTDNGDAGIPGWKITLTGTAVNETVVGPLVKYTDAAGNYAFTELLPGTYTVTETMANSSWLNTTPKSIAFELTPGEIETGNNFGNVCLGAGGGLTLGFWSNKNGEALFIVGSDLQEMKNLNLRNANGTHFDPANYAAFRTWLLNANATNMAYMLSAQLSAMKLNVINGKVDGGSILYAPGTQSGCAATSAAGFVTVTALMACADAELGLHGSVLADSPYRTYQEALKNALDKGNNNLNFVQSSPCKFTTPY